MATTITAGNATNGAAVTSDNTGILELKTGTGSGTTALTLSTAQAATFAGAVTASGLVTGATGALYPIVSGTAITLTNQTAPAFTDIPSWAKRITINVRGLSTNGTAPPLIQLGTGATPTYATSGYLGSNTLLVSAAGVAVVNFTTAFGIGLNTSNWTAATVINGSVTISLLDATNNVWCASGTFGASSATWMYFTAGSVALSAALTAVRLYIDGTQQFDAGTINILYE